MREVSKVSGVSFFVTLNLFQGLAIVTNRMPPTLTLPLKWGGNQKYVILNLFQDLKKKTYLLIYLFSLDCRLGFYPNFRANLLSSLINSF